ncbi:MAG: hypothetical protein JWM33_2932 [Caulobacteraceae bacterium]|nr:hypothetical protein [Caulobacteraceae bacterium]
MFDRPTVINVVLCLLSLPLMLAMLRRERMSLGLPLAYLLLLLLNHVPGAYGYLASHGAFGSYGVARGLGLTTIGIGAFVAGVAISHIVLPSLGGRKAHRQHIPAGQDLWSNPLIRTDNGPLFWYFCLVAGWMVTFGLAALVHVPSLGALIDKGGAIWMIGVMMGMAYSIHRSRVINAAIWASALMVYPAVGLVLGGFLSFGSATVIIVGAALAVLSRGYWRTLATICVVAVVGINLFVNYFEARTELRNVLWSGASLEQRVDAIVTAASHSHIFSSTRPEDLSALDLRLNQNYFVGVSAERLKTGYVGYLHGKSIMDGFIAVIPRALWPDKPVYGGSSDLVRNMTGLDLAINTSWGVGQVMEFYINFSLPGLIIGFLIFGMVLGWLDRKAAQALRTDVGGKVFFYFLPAAAMVQPISSLVEVIGGAAAGLGAAYFWRWAWIAYRQGAGARSARARHTRQLN